VGRIRHRQRSLAFAKGRDDDEVAFRNHAQIPAVSNAVLDDRLQSAAEAAPGDRSIITLPARTVTVDWT